MSRRAWILFAVAAVLWGVPYLLVKVALTDFSAVFSVWTRAVLGAAVLLPLAWRAGALSPLRGRMRQIGWLALLDLTIPTLLVTLGTAAIPSSLAGTLVASVPLLVALLALRFDHAERATGWRLAGLVTGVVGVALLLGFETSDDVRALLGGVLVLSGAASYAGATLYYKRHLASLPPLGVVAGALVGCAAFMTLPAALSLPTAVPSAGAVLAVAGLGVGCTAGGFFAFYSLIGLIGAGRASVITYVAPAISVSVGAAFLGESVTAASAAGLLLVLAGSWLSTGGRPPAPPGGLAWLSRTQGGAASSARAARRARPRIAPWRSAGPAAPRPAVG